MKKLVLAAALGSISAVSFGQSFSESFDVITGATATATGTIIGDQTWEFNNASSPLGTTSWFQGNSSVFAAQAGPATGYIGANFNNTTGANNINNWLMSSVRTFNNGDTISFWTRTTTGTFPDRLRLMLSTAGSSTAVASFTTTLLSVNESLATGTAYPNVWTQFTATISGLGGPVAGRFAFNYNVTNGGPSGANSDYIGIDSVQYTAVPEPASMAALGLGALALIRRRRAKKA